MISSLIVLFNYMLVAIVEPIIDRYTFYSDLLYFVAIVLTIDYCFIKSKKHINESAPPGTDIKVEKTT